MVENLLTVVFLVNIVHDLIYPAFVDCIVIFVKGWWMLNG